MFGVLQVDEGIAHVRLALDERKYRTVHGQVKKVVAILEGLVNFFSQQLTGVLVGNVLDHQGGPSVFRKLVKREPR